MQVKQRPTYRVPWAIFVALLFIVQGFFAISYGVWVVGGSHKVVPGQEWRGWMTCALLGIVAYVEIIYRRAMKQPGSKWKLVFLRRFFLIYATVDNLVTALTLNWVWLGLPITLLLIDSAISLKKDIQADHLSS